MTIIEAISKIDELKPNSYSDHHKIGWLADLDGIIKNEIIDTHEGGENIPYSRYNDNTDTGTVLLVPAPYDDIYVKWLEAKIDYANAEYGKYNNSSVAYNNAYSAYERYYNRHNMPIRTKLKFF